MSLVSQLRALGALQITWGDFQCTLEPPNPFAPAPPREAVLAGQDDDVFEPRSDSAVAVADAKKRFEQKQRAVEFELYAASEMRD